MFKSSIMNTEAGYYWKQFCYKFKDKYFDILANESLRRLSKYTPEDLFQNPHILLYGNETTVLKILTRAILETILQTTSRMKKSTFEVVNNNNKYACPYKYCNTFIEIDMAEITSSERQFISEFIYKHIACTKNISQEKHIIVMHNVNTLSENSIYALRQPLEKFSKNILFIFTTKNLSIMQPAILSRFMMIRCNFQEDNLINFFEEFATDHEIEGDVEIDPGEGLVMNLLRMATPDMESTITRVIRTFMESLLKEKNIIKACEMVRVFAYKIMHFNVSIATIMKETITICQKDKRLLKHIHKIIQLSAELEHQSRLVNKQTMILEQYYLCIYKYGTSKHT
jgi:hypothetical protein